MTTWILSNRYKYNLLLTPGYRKDIPLKTKHMHIILCVFVYKPNELKNVKTY